MPIPQTELYARLFDSSSIRSIKHSTLLCILLGLVLLLLFVAEASAHNVSKSDRDLISGTPGLQVLLYGWLGAKHMVTGYDHLLFLAGVIFYLRKISEIAVFVSLFALGHTITLISGVLLGLDVSSFVVDAIIGLSVAYKGFDNLGGFQRLFGDAPDERLAVFIFGLFHGLGLGSKLQDLGLHSEGLVGNLIAFNVGVELGQFAALLMIILLLRLLTWRPQNPDAHIGANRIVSRAANVGLVVAGFTLMSYQLAQL